MPPVKYVCTDPSHPPVVQGLGQETLYKVVLEKVLAHRKAGVPVDHIATSVSAEVTSKLNRPWDSVYEAGRLQSMRRQIARDWGGVLCRLDNLGHLTGWFINDCQTDGDERHFLLCLFALEGIRNLFAISNQLRSALPQDTIGYLRTMYETCLRSRFIVEYFELDQELPGRYLYYTNSKYLKLYRLFAPDDDPHADDNMWAEYHEMHETRYPTKGEGDYGWAYPHIKKPDGTPSRRPGFGQLMKTVDRDSIYSGTYYEVFASKGHGEFIWSPLMVRAEGRGTHIDAFSVGGLGLILDLALPLFQEILENTRKSCSCPDHATVMDVVITEIAEIDKAVEMTKSSNPEMHGGAKL